MRYLAAATSPSGKIRKPLVLQYNRDDFLIPARCQPVSPAMVQSAHGRAPTMLPPVGEGHCRFTPEQIVQAFQALTDEVQRDPQACWPVVSGLRNTDFSDARREWVSWHSPTSASRRPDPRQIRVDSNPCRVVRKARNVAQQAATRLVAGAAKWSCVSASKWLFKRTTC
jgi:hypothetical protein